MRILILSSYAPYPPDAGAKIVLANQMRYLQREHEVVLMCPVRPNSSQAQDAYKLVGEYCTAVRPVEWHKRSKVRFIPHLLRYLREGEPISNLYFYFEELAAALANITAAEHFDVVFFQHAYMAPYLDAIAPRSKCRTVLSLHNIPYVQWKRMMLAEQRLRRKALLFRDLFLQKRATLRHVSRFDRTIVISEVDRSFILRDAPEANVVTVRAGIDTDALRLLDPPAQLRTLMLVGSMYYRPNVDAALFLCREIFPRVRQRIPDARLFVIGSRPASEVLRLGQAFDGVTVTGHVESVLPYYQQCCLSLVPLRAGSGVRLKILESMCLGRPVISTTLGAEGLQAVDGQEIMLADSAADFAEEVIQLMTGGRLWRRIAINARSLVETLYDWHVTGRELVQALQEN